MGIGESEKACRTEQNATEIECTTKRKDTLKTIGMEINYTSHFRIQFSRAHSKLNRVCNN